MVFTGRRAWARWEGLHHLVQISKKVQETASRVIVKFWFGAAGRRSHAEMSTKTFAVVVGRSAPSASYWLMWREPAHPLAEISVLRLTESFPSNCVAWKRTVRLVTSDRVSNWSPFTEARPPFSGSPADAGAAGGVQVHSGKCDCAVLGCSGKSPPDVGRWRVSGVKSSPSASAAGKLAIATAGTRALAASRSFLISPPDSGARTGADVVSSRLTRIVLRLKVKTGLFQLTRVKRPCISR